MNKENEIARLRAKNHELDQIIRVFLRGGREAAFMRQQLLYKPQYSDELKTVMESIISILGLADKIAEQKNKDGGETSDQSNK
jgi:hypothetical protein